MYRRFITKLLAKKLRCCRRYKSCPNDITKAAYYKSFTDARNGIFNDHKHLDNKIIDNNNVDYFFTNLLITNLAVIVALA